MLMMLQKPKLNLYLHQRLLAGDTAALSYAISALQNNTPAGREIYSSVMDRHWNTPIIGFTGPPGVGKSTLINAYIHVLRKNRKRVAVVAIDPSSPISGGAILGDRFRMVVHAGDPGVFIRSVSNRGHLGGLCSSIFGIIGLIDAAGWDVILLETVGAGQSDTDMTDIADIRIVVHAPGLGDDLQAIKAGIFEIADVLVVNKADMPLADITVQQMETMVELRYGRETKLPVIRTIATQGKGIDRLQEIVESQIAGWKTLKHKARYTKRMHRFFAREIGQMTEQAVAGLPPPELVSAYEQYLLGKKDMKQIVETVVRELLSHLSQEEKKLNHSNLREKR